MATRLKKLRIRELSLVRSGANQGANVLFFKSGDPMNPVQNFLNAIRDALHSVAVSNDQRLNVDKALDEAAVALESTSLEEPMAKCKECGADLDDAGKVKKEDEVLKGATPAQVEAIEKARAEAAAAIEKANQLEAKEKHREAVAKSTVLLGQVPGASAEEFAKVLRHIPAEDMPILEAVMKAANAAVSEAELFNDLGTPGTRRAGVGEKLEAIATSLVKELGLTKSQAIAKALEIDPTLYEDSAAAGK